MKVKEEVLGAELIISKLTTSANGEVMNSSNICTKRSKFITEGCRGIVVARALFKTL